MMSFPRASWQNLKDRPFATALGFLLLMAGIVALTRTSLTGDALAELVPQWLLVSLSAAYALGGLLILSGMAFRKPNLEAAGCVLTGNGLLVRLVALLYTLGLTPATVATSSFYIVFGWACWIRFRQIAAGDSIIRVRREIELLFEGDEDADSS